MSSRKIFIDPRWKNAGGIGTFYEQINKYNNYEEYTFLGKPTSPVDAFRTGKVLFENSKDIFFFPGYIPPIINRAKYIFTIHDLNHLDRKENSSFSKKIFYETIIKNGCARASYIFTVSEFSKNRILQWSGVSSDKVINVGNGVSSDFSPFGESVDLGFEYLLCVGNRKKHKNELSILYAFKQAKIRNDFKLVFTGKPDALMLDIITKLDLKDKVHFTGFVSSSYLPKLYRSASALVFPSLYEGFGLPVIEAQASGIPVLTSRSSSLGEVSGGAAILVDPNDIRQITDGIEKIVNDTENNNKLRAAGIENSKRYSWYKTAQLVDKYLKKLTD